MEPVEVRVCGSRFRCVRVPYTINSYQQLSCAFSNRHTCSQEYDGNVNLNIHLVLLSTCHFGGFQP